MFFVILSFVIIAAMRLIQNLCGKTASRQVTPGISFFRYGAYYNLAAALFALITLAITGFTGFNLPTLLCSLVSAILFSIDLFTSLQTMKGAPLTVCSIFGLGGLIVSCIGGIFLFNEPVSWLQGVGLAIFLIGAYVHTQKGKKETKKISFYTYVLLFLRLFINGLVMIVQKYFSLNVVGGNVSTFSFLTFLLNFLIMLVCAIVLYLKSKNRPTIQTEPAVPDQIVTEEENPKPQKTILGLSKILLVCGGLLAFALFVINFLVTELGKTVDSVILFPVSSAISIVMTAFIGWVVFKEKLNLKSIIGLIVALAGIIIIGL